MADNADTQYDTASVPKHSLPALSRQKKAREEEKKQI